MLFKKVAISEKTDTHNFFNVGFISMLIGLFVTVLYVSGILVKELSLGYVSGFVVSFVCAYTFYRCALSPNGYLNAYLKFWWYLANGGEKEELKWYDKIMFVISIMFSLIGVITLFYITILLIGLVMAVC